MIVKILFCGDIKGQFSKLIEKLASLDEKHGTFEAVISAGILFSDEDNNEFEQLKSGQLELPIPLIVLGPQKPQHCGLYGDVEFLNGGGEICHNLIYPGKSGIYRFVNGGLTMAYLSPEISEDAACGVNNKEFSHLKKLVEKSMGGFKGVDFFVTPCWPQGITTYAHVPKELNDIQCRSSVHISHLAKLLKPRYHLANSTLQPYGCHYERAPYRNHPTNATLQEHVTRFVSLASAFNANNSKWLYAIRITPLGLMPLSELVEQPSNTTESPYIALPSLLKTGSNQYSTQLERLGFVLTSEFLLVKNSSDLHSGGPIRTNRKPKSATNVTNEPCWFCLNNPKLAKHLIVYIGSHNYVVLAKGGIVPHHLLIVPIEHFSNTLELSQEALDEIQYLKKLLVSLFKLEGSSMIFYERNYASRHLQIQVVPVPRGNPDSLVNTFVNHGRKNNIQFEDISNIDKQLDQMVNHNDNYFYVEFEDNRKLLHKIEGKFPLYFGREILASKDVLSLPSYRVDWRKCVLSEQDEKTVVDEIKMKLNMCRKNV